MSSTARLRIVQITDVYTLVNFPSVKTLLDEKRAEVDQGGKTISVLTGDFLAPYLLSSFDKGVGMMSMLNKTPIDYLIWGNHEHDLDHADVMQREREYKGTWINSNMKSHESFSSSKCQVDAATVEIVSQDGTNRRKLGMIGVLSDSPGLYRPGAFGGAVIEDPFKCLAEYNERLKAEGCDMVLPLCHLYEPQDEETCKEFDFPVVMSGHDHHRVDRIVEGTRLLKPGMDGHYAIVLDLVWDSAASDKTPTITAETIKVADYPADPDMQAEVESAYSVLAPLMKSELATVPDTYAPLTSRGAREGRVTMATYLCDMLKEALNLDSSSCGTKNCDCFVYKGGNSRGERDYSSFKFSMETLGSEMDRRENVHMFLTPGHILKTELRTSWKAPGPGWLQYDSEVEVDDEGLVVSIDGQPLDDNRMYRVGSLIDFSYGPPYDWATPLIHDYFEEHPEGLPDEDAGIGSHFLLLKIFSANIWKRLWNILDADGDGVVSAEDLKVFDTNGDGSLTKAEISEAMSHCLKLSSYEGQDALIDMVLVAAGDVNNDGVLTLEEINNMHMSRSS
jgi:hypothetical protein